MKINQNIHMPSSENITLYLKNPNMWNILTLTTIDSTNSYLKSLISQNIPDNTVVIANQQTAGRGRMGHSFFSPPDTGIYMSILLNPDKIDLHYSLLTIAAGTAVCRALSSFCCDDPKIKWVNDIFINGKKVGGILAESVQEIKSNTITNIIVGIGINVNTLASQFPGDLRNFAGSIFPDNISRNEIIAKILNAFYDILKLSPTSLIDEYKSYSLILNKSINFIYNGNPYRGIATDINTDGNLIVKLEDGNLLILKSGEVHLGSENFAQ